MIEQMENISIVFKRSTVSASLDLEMVCRLCCFCQKATVWIRHLSTVLGARKLLCLVFFSHHINWLLSPWSLIPPHKVPRCSLLFLCHLPEVFVLRCLFTKPSPDFNFWDHNIYPLQEYFSFQMKSTDWNASYYRTSGGKFGMIGHQWSTCWKYLYKTCV